MKFPSKKTLDENTQVYPAVPHGDYTLQVIRVEEETQKAYESNEMENVIRVRFAIISDRDGNTAENVKGQDATGKIIFFTGRPDSIGFRQDGTPSKTRSLVAYATGQDIMGEIELSDWQALLGRAIDAEILIQKNAKGFEQNKIVRFIAPKRQKTNPVPAKDNGIPIIEDEEESIDIKDIPL